MLVIIKTQITPPHIQGYLRRFLSEIETNLFIGQCTRRVIDKMWTRLSTVDDENFRAKLILPMNVNEQGFLYFEHNSEGYTGVVVENDEILLFGRPLL